MNEMSDIGRLTRVEVREVWPNESQDFTPWLLENADALGEALGMELDLQEAEHTVGDFSLDLIGEDTTSGDQVIIENQLSRTDHSHLGQLLTYAGGTHPSNVVWIADRFRDEHRAALDWLNERTDDQTRFFGVEINAVKIGDSNVAPQFVVVAGPNSWQKEVKESTSKGSSPRRQAYQSFWTLVIAEMQTRNATWTNRKTPSSRYWMGFASGTSKVRYELGFTQNNALFEIYFGSRDRDANLANFHQLRESAEVLKEKTGIDFVWEERPHAAACAAIVRKEADFRNEETWSEEAKWLVDTLLNVRDAIESLGGMSALIAQR
mgnify:CR=1 FL=1